MGKIDKNRILFFVFFGQHFNLLVDDVFIMS